MQKESNLKKLSVYFKEYKKLYESELKKDK